MLLCREYGISHSFYLGGRNRWIDIDRDKALALELYMREKCPNCGTLPGDWQDTTTNRVLNEPRWMVSTHRCYGCKAIEQTRRAIPEGEAGVYPILVAYHDHLDDDD